MLYLDTSLIVAAATIEAETAKVQAWLRTPRGRALATNAWSITEFSAALSIKLRRKVMTVQERDEAIEFFRTRFLDAVHQADVIPDDFLVAARLSDRHMLGLRGCDALHLAVATRLDATLCTLDKGQAEAGRALSIDTLLV